MPSKIAAPKRKRGGGPTSRQASPDLEDQLPEVDDMNLESTRAPDNSDSENELEKRETSAQKRLRLAKQYLKKIKEDIDSDDPDSALIAERLEHDALEKANKVFHLIALKYQQLSLNTELHVRTLKCHRNGHMQSITSVSVAIPDASIAAPGESPIYLFSTSKDACIVKWDFYTGEKLSVMKGGLKPTKRIKKRLNGKQLQHIGHNDDILCSSASKDGKYLATGGRDKTIFIWDVQSTSLKGSFKQHRDAITSLAFRIGSNQLYSCSLDRSVKCWNVDELSYVETLFGHQDGIACIDTLTRERCITAGSRDRTIRMWKIVEESQLVYRCGASGNMEDDLLMIADEAGNTKKKVKVVGATGGSVDVVCMIDEDTFVSGSDSGANRKKPIYTRLRCHGKSSQGDNCNWINSLASVPYSDLFASGSSDGEIRFWKTAADKKSFSPLFSTPLIGFVNSLSFFYAPQKGLKTGEKDCLYLTAGVGKEHRLGRWWNIKEARNCIKIITIG